MKNLGKLAVGAVVTAIVHESATDAVHALLAKFGIKCPCKD